MTIQKAEFDLLVEIHKHLKAEEARPDLASALLTAINRMNRERELAWSRTHRPKPLPDSRKTDDRSLMQRLLDAGYPASEMDHHSSDLYVYVTPETTRIIDRWCQEREYDRTRACPTFYDQVSGKPMYDCAFQFDPALLEQDKDDT